MYYHALNAEWVVLMIWFIFIPGGLPLPFYGAQSLSSAHPFFNPALLSNPMMNMLTSPLGAAANLMGGAGGLQHPHLAAAARLTTTAPNSITSTGIDHQHSGLNDWFVVSG